jgi:hypothetical protein
MEITAKTRKNSHKVQKCNLTSVIQTQCDKDLARLFFPRPHNEAIAEYPCTRVKKCHWKEYDTRAPQIASIIVSAVDAEIVRNKHLLWSIAEKLERPYGRWQRDMRYYNKPWRSRGGVEIKLYSFFNLDTRWGRVINNTSRPLYPWERHPVPNLYESDWALALVWTDAENLASTGIRFPNRPSGT